MKATLPLSLFLLVFSFLCIQMTCVDTNKSSTLGTEICIDSTKIEPMRGCPRNYDPVCGCDGKTYSNICTAEKNGVVKWTKGECEDEKDESTTAKDCIDKSKISLRPCPDNYDPVCGCDNKTYTNACSAEVQGLTSWTKGACCIDKSKISRRPCKEIYQPVCGCDGKTYGNECEAKNQGLTSWTEGPCEKTKNGQKGRGGSQGG